MLEVKRPLIVMTPKSLLRSADAACNVEDLTSGQFNTVLEDSYGSGGKVEHVVFCSGKVFYDLRKTVESLDNVNVKIIRVEQLYPFPQFELKKALKDIEAKSYTWVQEEPRNMGAWFYMEPYLRQKFSIDVKYVGRELSASTATGSAKHHIIERDRFLSELVGILS